MPETLDLAALGRAVVARRTQRSWSTHRLSVNAGVADPYLRRIESGQTPSVGLDVLHRIARALGTTVPQLFREADLDTGSAVDGELAGVYDKLGPIERRALVRTAHTLREIQVEYAALQARDEPAGETLPPDAVVLPDDPDIAAYDNQALADEMRKDAEGWIDEDPA